MRKLIAAAAIATAVAGCGGSGHPSVAQQCHAYAVKTASSASVLQGQSLQSVEANLEEACDISGGPSQVPQPLG